MKAVAVWPFLISRNKYLDYTTVVAPDFMCKAGAASILTNRAGGAITGEDIAFYREIHESKVGKFTLVFRVIQTTFEEMGIEGSGVLRERGKKILLIEGIVIRGLEKKVIVTKEDLQKVHSQIIEPYREFWKCTSSRLQTVTPSNFFELSQDSSKFCLRYQIQEPYIGNVNQQKTEVLDRPQGTNTARVNNYQKSSRSQEWRSQPPIQFEAEVTSVAFLPKGDYIAIRYEHKQTVIIKNLYREEEPFFKDDEISSRQGFTPIAISPDGQYMATAVINHKDENVVKVWNLTEGKKDAKPNYEHQPYSQGRVLTVAFTPDSQILVSGGKDKTLRFSDVETGGIIEKPIKEFTSELRAIVINPKEYNHIIVIGNSEGIIESWNWQSREKGNRFKAHEAPVNSLAFSHDGKIFVSGGDDCTIKLWDVDSGKELNSRQHSNIVKTVAFSPDGKLIASGDDSGIIKIWDVGTMESEVLPRHAGGVTSLAFSPDGKTLASGSKDRTVRLWKKV